MAPTFASAAAQNSNSARDNADWSRRASGATQTFRRTSGTPQTISSNSTQDVISTPQAARYVPPHRSNGTFADTRYSKEQLLDLFRTQQQLDGGFEDGLSDLYIGGWRPEGANGSAGSAWARGEQSRDNQPGAEVCWELDGSVEPIGLHEMDDEERELFISSVNTPLKPPTNTKENQTSNGPPGGRKPSISNLPTTPGAYGPLSPSTTRVTARRRETNESLQPMNNPLTPAGNFGRDEQRTSSPPPSLIRRRTDVKDSSRDTEADDKAAPNPFGSMKRTTTNPLSSGFGNASSPWSNSPQSAGLPPMGSFGNFGLGQQGSAVEKRPSLAGGRAESRFKNVLNKDGSDEGGAKPSVERKTSMSNLPRVNENESWRPQQPQDTTSALLEDEELSSGGATFNTDNDSAPARGFQGGLRSFGTPSRSDADYGFGAFGMTSDHQQGLSQGFYQQSPGHQRQMTGNEPMSPTDTDPYQSPENARDEVDADDVDHPQLSGLGGFGNDQSHPFGALGGLGALPNLGRAGGQATASDRSQTSSAGPNRGFPSLGNLGQLGSVPGSAAWPVSHGGIGTPTRQTSGLGGGFGSGFFAGGLGDVHSPGLAGLGGSMLSPQGSRMAGMFPSAMQDHRQSEVEQSGERGFASSAEYERGLDGSSGYGDSQRQQIDRERSLEQLSAQFGALSQQPPIGPSSHDQARSAQHQSPAPGQPSGSSASSQLPPTQQRTMVMPDRMRWIYRDPQGQTQGPWSGLEMHDWYKAGFFSPELLVKKYEDPEYEPLAQLIRRIGNSREPFLVPQIGIPHGQPSNNGPNAWAGTSPAGPATATGGTQPPFASSFPSFGTTLTAEQQNALERRKQEEQYLMARQKEHLAQAQIAQRMQHQQQIHHGGMQHHGSSLMSGSGQLHHHGSAQSLHSQPSMGSLASPSAAQFQSSPGQGPQGQAPGFFDGAFRAPGQGTGLGAIGAGLDTLGQIREEDMSERLTFGQRAQQSQFGAPGQALSGKQMQSTGNEAHDRQVQQMLEDRARLQQEQDLQGVQNFESNERLQQFQQLQGKIDSRFQSAQMMDRDQLISSQQEGPEPTLTEQVQKAASTQQSPAPQQPGLIQPFPPAPSQSPLPAPAAQRTGRQSVADQLQTEQREMSETSSVDTPSAVAPWAKEVGETNRGPSLKEIQEMEAKQAAQAEEIAAAARRAAMQKEMEAQALQAQSQAIAAPGLPASASWAAGSPSTPTGSNGAAWAKAAQKPTTTAAAKSMAQIQKEEEARKKKLASAAAAAAQTTVPVVATAGAKSYANLAGKVAPPPGVPGPGGSWTTVGAGGKTKTPAAPPASAPTRAVSSNVVPSAAIGAAAVRKAPVRSVTSVTAGGVNAQDEFRKWAIGELRPDLNKGISAEEFVLNLVALPQDSDIITEAVHGASSTIDSRHFAEEFIRRKRLADKGLVDSSAPPKSASPHSAGVDKSGGWSEVAKKGPVKEGAVGVSGAKLAGEAESNGSFRVVASKKKGGKR